MTRLLSLLPEDRFSVALLIAVCLHLLILLGIPAERPRPLPKADQILEVLVIQPRQPSSPPEEAKLLAPENQQGADPSPTLIPAESPPAADPPAPPRSAPQAPPPPPEPVIEPEPPAQVERAVPPPVATPPPRVTESPSPVIAPQRTPVPLQGPRSNEIATRTLQPAPRRVHPSIRPSRPGSVAAADLLRSTDREIYRLTSSTDTRKRVGTGRLKRKFISAGTREYKYAAYMNAWRSKVERIGNLNYPEQAKRERLFGSLILTVGILPDGSIESVEVVRGSSYPLLNQAAERIVRLAAPFAPLPSNILKETDVLHITRTWHFRESNQLTSR